jgi:hypothetical protein
MSVCDFFSDCLEHQSHCESLVLPEYLYSNCSNNLWRESENQWEKEGNQYDEVILQQVPSQTSTRENAASQSPELSSDNAMDLDTIFNSQEALSPPCKVVCAADKMEQNFEYEYPSDEGEEKVGESIVSFRSFEDQLKYYEDVEKHTRQKLARVRAQKHYYMRLEQSNSTKADFPKS